MIRNPLQRSIQRVRMMADGGPAALPADHRRSGAGARGIVLKLLALGLVIGAATWAYYANVTSPRPTMDMSGRVSPGAVSYPVSVGVVERGPITGTVVYTGSVAPFNEEDVFPRVTGRIVDMPVYPGDAVRAGQIVARLDDIELASRTEEATAAAMAAAANVAQMDADVLAAGHGVAQMEREVGISIAEVTAARDAVTQMEKELAMAEAETGYQEQVSAREEQLFTRGVVARQDVENARALLAAARAKVAAAHAKVAQARAMVVAAEAKVSAAGEKLDQARAMEVSARKKRDAMTSMAAQGRAMQRTAEVVKDYVNIRASRGGYVVKRLVAPGVLVQPGMAILKIAEIGRVRLQANVGENDLGSIRVGSAVVVTSAGTGQDPLTARVTSVFPFVDQGARTAVVEAIVDNPGRRFLPGQYVTMRFVTGERPDTLSVPASAVARLGGTAKVWLVQEDRATPREVATGLANADRIEITACLTGQERVVVRGHEGLYAGARVTDVASTARGGSNGRRTIDRAPAATERREPHAGH
jgi:RND family efflux transporter MFP subunit